MAIRDIRIAVDIVSHPKTRRLIRELDYQGFFCLVALWIAVSKHKPSGDLSGWDDDDIEGMAMWDGEKGVFLKALLSPKIKFLVETNGVYTVHDWKEHNPWAANSEKRSIQARKAGLAKWKSREGPSLRPETG